MFCIYDPNEFIKAESVNWTSPYVFYENKDQGDVKFDIYVNISGMPAGSTFMKISYNDADATNDGIIYGASRTLKC